MIKKIMVPVLIGSVMGILGYIAYDRITGSGRKSTEAALEQQAKKDQDTIAALEEKVFSLEETLEKEEDTSIPKEEIARAFGEKEAGPPSPDTAEFSCDAFNLRITSFFKYLDEKKYVHAHGLDERAQEFFQKAMELLIRNEPQITGEMQELPVLMKNLAYFYRILGRNRLAIARDVIDNEADIIESAMTTVYRFYQADTECNAKIISLPSLETAYQYALFFLNTLAGKSYLVRRNSKMRIITSYYCTLIIDRANEKGLNRYGFDIRPQLAMLLGDIQDHKRLVYKAHYLEVLKRLQRKYAYQ